MSVFEVEAMNSERREERLSVVTRLAAADNEATQATQSGEQRHVNNNTPVKESNH